MATALMSSLNRLGAEWGMEDPCACGSSLGHMAIRAGEKGWLSTDFCDRDLRCGHISWDVLGMIEGAKLLRMAHFFIQGSR